MTYKKTLLLQCSAGVHCNAINNISIRVLQNDHQVGDILGVRSKAEWAENGTLGNAAVDREAGRLAAR